MIIFIIAIMTLLLVSLLGLYLIKEVFNNFYE